jgi:inner membrane transporter RhtA
VPIAGLIVAMLCFQVGAALAKGLFPVVGASGAVALRLGIAALLLSAVWRPWRARLDFKGVRIIALYGIAMGCMNFFFYLSLRYIPLGIAVALEFTGPLGLAMLASRKPLDFLWILLAVLGLLALLPMGAGAAPLPPIGIFCALAAAVCWALYIVFGRRAGTAHGAQTTALGTIVAAILIVPIGVGQNGMSLFSPALLPLACGVALLSSAVPYTLEMFAMPRIATKTFGVLMSLDPAVAALSGMLFLGERLTVTQWAAVICIMVASGGSAATATSAAAPPAAQSLPD